jgi:hypothetical protein
MTTPSTTLFKMNKHDWLLVQYGRQTARTLMLDITLTPCDIRSLGAALLALERLPEVTAGVNVAFGAKLDSDKNDSPYSELRYSYFTVTDDAIGFENGGLVRHQHGMDTIPPSGYVLRIDGYRRKDVDPSGTKQRILEMLRSGGQIEVEDESEHDTICWYEDESVALLSY